MESEGFKLYFLSAISWTPLWFRFGRQQPCTSVGWKNSYNISSGNYWDFSPTVCSVHETKYLTWDFLGSSVFTGFWFWRNRIAQTICVYDRCCMGTTAEGNLFPLTFSYHFITFVPKLVNHPHRICAGQVCPLQEPFILPLHSPEFRKSVIAKTR